jgi:hypothetical protein
MARVRLYQYCCLNETKREDLQVWVTVGVGAIVVSVTVGPDAGVVVIVEVGESKCAVREGIIYSTCDLPGPRLVRAMLYDTLFANSRAPR